MPAPACAGVEADSGEEGNRRPRLKLLQLLGMHQINWACSFSELLKKLSPQYLFEAALVK